MSYILCLGFKTIIYKTPAKIRVFIDNIFLDEFSLITNKLCDTNNYRLASKSWHKQANTVNWYRLKENRIPVHYKDFNTFYNEDIIFRMFEIDSKFFKKNFQHELRIELVNSSNNYTNGFMTQSTLISLYVVQLIPKDVLLDAYDYANALNGKNNKIEKSRHTDVKEILNYYTKEKLYLWDILENNFQINFQINKNQKEYKELLAWKLTKQNSIDYVARGYWLGEKGSYVLTILNSLIKSGYENIINCTFHDIELIDLSNKYKQYENQRNTD